MQKLRLSSFEPSESKLDSPPVLASSCRTNLYDIKMTSCTGRTNKLQLKHIHTHTHTPAQPHIHAVANDASKQAVRQPGRHKLRERAPRRGSLTCPLYTKCVAFTGVCEREKECVCLCVCSPVC